MTSFSKFAVAAVVCVVGSIAFSPTVIASIIGPSDTLNNTEAGQLASWLGQGDLDFTRIFSKSADGATAGAFHAASDGQGATFSVMTLDNGLKIGGYNPQSWSSGGYYNRTYDPLERTAFLFNLTSSTLYLQNTQPNTARGIYQTYNHYSYGPTFGGGHDLHVGNNLSSGYANIGYTYGDPSRFATTTYRNEFAGGFYFNIVDLEVFTFAPSSGGTVPEPTSLIVWGLFGAIAMNRRRR